MSTALKDAGVRAPELAPAELAPAPQLPAVLELKRVDAPAPARVYPAKIAKAILAVTKAIGHITKDGVNKFQGYSYVKWEDVCERLSPLLADHDLIMVQTEKSRHLIEENDKGSTLSIVYGFSFVDGDGNTWPEIEWTALARLRDQKGVTDDKAAAKCHTQAEKYFCIKQFKIRTADAIDSDADGRALPQDDSEILIGLQAEINAQPTKAKLEAWGFANEKRFLALPEDLQGIVTRCYQERLKVVTPPPKADGLANRAIAARNANKWDGDGLPGDLGPPREQPRDRESHRAMMRESMEPLDHTDHGGIPAFCDRRG